MERNSVKEKIIVALDVETADEARKIIDEIGGEVGAFKIGLQLFTAAGASFVREIVGQKIKLFLDVKFHDIPNTVAKASVEVARLGVWMFNVHALGGTEMMRRTVENMREVCAKENLVQPKIIGVTVLTSANRETLREVGITQEIDSQVLNLARLTAKCGLDGVVASPLEAGAIRRNVEKKDFLIVTPGIRPGFATNDDQKRVMTPKEALVQGADYLVIGRPITAQDDKTAAVRKILEEIETE
ncbi:MAG TPA: orotidine-5'-phosphate decarboxylase [Pyrinomonadaceae bacterium]|jgi:orotidine-5'-phosphate decarboxylase|nr:orotidine-5'-phosphate decarboxylase [Pyrinomonadaceae bacterium]